MKKTDFFRFGFVALYNRKERESKWVPIIDKEKKMVAVMIKCFAKTQISKTIKKTFLLKRKICWL